MKFHKTLGDSATPSRNQGVSKWIALGRVRSNLELQWKVCLSPMVADLSVVSEFCCSRVQYGLFFSRMRAVRFLMALLLCSVSIGWQYTSALAQSISTLPQGFHRVDGQRLTVVTDLPVDDELRRLPLLFEQAMKNWSNLFSVPLGDANTWRVTMYLMLERQRFKDGGLLPPEIPEFPHGWQSGDKIWINEQPSPYYRRHLMLHEGTHWFMERKYGKYHAPWFMEGMAEWLATHRVRNGILELAIIPNDKLEVPFWGRISVIQQQLSDGVSPSMEDIWRYSNTAHQLPDAYAWSWAMVLFLNHHPSTSGLMQAVLKQPAMSTSEMERWLRSRLRTKLPRLRSEWAAFVADLDYGYTPTSGILSLSAQPSPLNSEVTLEIDTRLGWQASGIQVESGQELDISAEGEFVLAGLPRPWTSFPDGVTLEYYRGMPIGKLMMTIVGPIAKEPATTSAPAITPVGSKATVVTQTSGEVFFRINEPSGSLGDNSGMVTIRIR